MKKCILFFLAALVSLTGCVDKELENNIEDLENRVDQLEDLCDQMNADIENLHKIIDSMDAYVVKIDPIIIADNVIGYVIVFSNGENVTLKFGKDGQDGADGKDGVVPVIGVKYFHGKYYWTVDGEFLRDESGDKVPVNPEDGTDGQDGQDGADGQNGTDGQDGITPQLKIQDGYWYISYNGGASWEKLDKAVGEDGVDGIDVPSLIKRVDVSDSDFVVFVLSDGTEVKIPTWEVFENLQQLCNQMNTNISSFTTILTALQDKDFVRKVSVLKEGGKEVGYEIEFSKSGVIRIYNGKDGENLAEFQAPVIAIAQDADGLYYWTLNGEWILTESGEKMSAKGQPGVDGANGSEGIVPQLKIEDNFWFVSYNNGQTWEKLCQATGQIGAPGADAESLFQNVSINDDFIIFQLSDGTVLNVPYLKDGLVEKISSLTFIPAYADGRVPMVVNPEHLAGIATMEFMVTPKSLAAELEQSSELASVKASYTLTRSVDFIDLPILEFTADAENGIIRLSVSGENLGEQFFAGNLEAAVFLTLKDALASVSSDPVPMYSQVDVSIADALVFKYRTNDNLAISGTAISDKAFWESLISNEYDSDSNIGVLKVPYGTVLSAFAFKGISNLEFIELDSRLTVIGESAFEGCISLKSVALPKVLEKIDAKAFKECEALSSITLPGSLQEIGDLAFYKCALAKLTLPAAVTKIGMNAFANCLQLTKVYAEPTVPPVIAAPFANCSEALKIYVAGSAVESYKAAWTEYSDRILALE